MKPKILVTAAAGKTGAATALQLLEKGYPVRALVRRSDNRSEKLRRLGAEICVGDLEDIVDVRQALDGVQRAYYCPPPTASSLASSMIFATAVQEYKLEAITVMSQWLAAPTNPSLLTREMWLAEKLFALMPDVATMTVNPGWFADNYMPGLEIIAQLGTMMAPLGEGLNAPPSNEDMARVIVGTLTNPAAHAGKTYRPTGPRLLSPPQIAEIFGNVLGRKVRYQDAPLWLFSKVMKPFGFPDFLIAQSLTYYDEYRRNSFGIGAPTNAVLEVGGQEPEEFETIVRRYVAASPHVKRSAGEFSRTLVTLTQVMLSSSLTVETYNRQQGFPRIGNARLSADSPEWLQTHQNVTEERVIPYPSDRTSLAHTHS